MGVSEVFGKLFKAGKRRQAGGQAQPPPAWVILRGFNPKGLIGLENGFFCMIEDHADPDGRLFRLEYQSTPDGRRAVAWCRYNPWGSVHDMHTTSGGLICIGSSAHGPTPAYSSYDLNYVIPRARFWCTRIEI